MNAYHEWRTLRDLDRAAGLPKGSAFRCFKRALPQLQEGRDFVVLDHQRYAAVAVRLHAEDRLYRSSVRPVLLSPASAEHLHRQLQVQAAQQQ